MLPFTLFHRTFAYMSMHQTKFCARKSVKYVTIREYDLIDEMDTSSYDVILLIECGYALNNLSCSTIKLADNCSTCLVS